MAEQAETPTPAESPKRMLISFLMVLAVAYLAVVALVFFLQDRLLFFPATEILQTPADAGWTYEDLQLKVGEETTNAWYVPAEGTRRGYLLFSHGNAGNIGDRLDSIAIFRRLGLDVVIYDFGGYGRSSGKPSESRCYDDIRSVWRYLIEDRGAAAEEIVLFGRSLGAGPTCQLATEVSPGAVILESAFRSVPEMARGLYPWLPVRLLARTRLDNEAKIANIEAPLLVIHSVDDDIIPFAHGERLFELANEPKRFLEIHGDHNSGFLDSGALYVDGLREFLVDVLPSRG